MGGIAERAHTNSFDLLRLAAAALVVWSHQHALLGMPEPAVVALNASFGGVGVFIFFAISGYLNTLSIARHNSVQTFLVNRALRIYPALWACVLFTVALGLCVASDLHAYLGPRLMSFIVKNTTLLFGFEGGAAGVFEANPFPLALNGSLWTLQYEVKLYVVLAVLFAASRYSLFAPIVLFAAFVTTLALMHLGVLQPYQGDQYWIQFSTPFLAGSAIASIEMLLGMPVAIGSLALTAAIVTIVGNQLFARELLLTPFIIMVGRVPLPRRFQPRIDVSYSTYLYAFPIQQTVVMYTRDFWAALAISTGVTLALATISALLIERPALRLKGKTKSLSLISLARRLR
jgi:peptidoglycan/LPS O-acetylase OafA/YrhL